jgi:hypothetical protein
VSKAVTIELVGQYLKRRGLGKFEVIPQPGRPDGVILLGLIDPGGVPHPLFIDPRRDKDSLILHVQITRASPDTTPANRLTDLLMVMAALNYRIVIGKWAYDPKDGEVAFRAAMPIDSGQLDYVDFDHLLTAVLENVGGYAMKMTAIVQGSANVDEILQEVGMTIGG